MTISASLSFLSFRQQKKTLSVFFILEFFCKNLPKDTGTRIWNTKFRKKFFLTLEFFLNFTKFSFKYLKKFSPKFFSHSSCGSCIRSVVFYLSIYIFCCCVFQSFSMYLRFCRFHSKYPIRGLLFSIFIFCCCVFQSFSTSFFVERF